MTPQQTEHDWEARYDIEMKMPLIIECCKKCGLPHPGAEQKALDARTKSFIKSLLAREKRRAVEEYVANKRNL